MDIENFNYFDILFQEFFRNTRLRDHIKILPEINPGHSFIPVELNPPGMRIKRNPIKFINNYYVNRVTKAFTNYEKDARTLATFNKETYLDAIKELDNIRGTWWSETMS